MRKRALRAIVSTPPEDRRSHRPRESRKEARVKVVTAAYHDEESAAEAIQELTNAGVPVDEISVVVSGEEGEHEVSLMEKPTVMRGAVAGGAIGAALGGLGAVLAATGVITGPGILLYGAGPVLATIRGIVAGGGFGYGLGVLESLEFWKDEADLHGEDLKKGAALVVVHSDDLHDTARAVFERTGATRVTG